eukprot:CAMPEP_0197727878 /NCGR_PEP_ID=MMETSP1434-20131217/23564_1 /TAXON_ID=265543 /ORGANISM="Minutocellus polymorphus, Strain CCMP3303" /LENGTH=65 /DNA_ID=CAMNT_0043314183 /DNA_START=103 /DNA_END=298 /DNA_ORIENTATION=+
MTTTATSSGTIAVHIHVRLATATAVIHGSKGIEDMNSCELAPHHDLRRASASRRRCSSLTAASSS